MLLVGVGGPDPTSEPAEGLLIINGVFSLAMPKFQTVKSKVKTTKCIYGISASAAMASALYRGEFPN